MKTAVIIPTVNRVDKLRAALHSVNNQTHKPDRVIVVYEANELNYDYNKISSDFTLPITFLKNTHSKNLSGALNCGIEKIFDKEQKPEDIYCAFLDDDDTWEPEYLEICLKYSKSGTADWIISGIIRHEDIIDAGVLQTIPSKISSNDFFTGNPHIQGSNLFVRLSSILTAGGFDENLESTTDRDICIRLLEIQNLKIEFVPHHLVHHWALKDSSRLSTPGSPKKLRGLRAFYWKYKTRMNETELNEFKKRAKNLFLCEDFSDSSFETNTNRIQTKPKINEHIVNTPFIVGFTSTRIQSTVSLLNDLSELFAGTDLLREVIICDNTQSESDKKYLESLVNYKGLKIKIYSKEYIEDKCNSGFFGEYLKNPVHQRGIASGRCVLHHFLYSAMQNIPGSVSWILDDDIRLDYLSTNNEHIKLNLNNILSTITDLKSRGVSIAVGKITGDAPIPFFSTLRVQLIDILAELKRRKSGSSMKSKETLQSFSEKYEDYYYDYAGSNKKHLETPFISLLSEYSDEEFINRLLDLTHGKNISRPVAINYENQAPTEVKSGILPRGGNTLVLNPESLRSYPNISPEICGINLRRGDTFWCIENLRIGAKKIDLFPHAVRQERYLNNTIPSDYQMMFADACGSAFIKAMDEYYSSEIAGKPEVPKRINLEIPPDKINAISENIIEILSNRLKNIEINSYRISGLLETIISEIQNPIYSSSRYRQSVLDYLFELKKYINPELIRRELSQYAGNNNIFAQIGEFLNGFKQSVISYRHSLEHTISDDKINHAKDMIELVLNKRKMRVSNLQFVGYGDEGIVFRDGNTAYKYFYYGSMDFEDGRLKFVKENILNNLNLHYIPKLFDIIEEDGEMIFVESFEECEKYDGRNLESLLEYLNEAKENKIVCTNIHPKNLGIQNDKVILLDLGSSFIPYSPHEFEIMCRRAFISLKWHFADSAKLSELTDKSIYSSDFPEMFGYEYFKGALDKSGKSEILDDYISKIIAEKNPKHIFDFGCGKGSITSRLHEKGFEITGYDPDSEAIHRALKKNTDIRYIGCKEFSDLKKQNVIYDCIICSLVLCTITDDDEARLVVSDMRKLIDENGFAVVVICNPFSTFVNASNIQKRMDLPDDTHYNEKFVYQKRMYETGNPRIECHRPFSWYKQLFLNEGFTIENIEETKSVDINELTPASDFMILTLKPVKIPDNSNVSLLIKASPREWETIDMQISHIVRQLEGPQKFCEKIIVTDIGGKESARIYSEESYNIFLQKLNELKNNKTVDNILILPDDSAVIGSINRKWFNLDSSSDRSKNLQPVPMFLYGVEKCSGDYILALDSDAIIVRKDRSHDYMGEMISVLKNDSNGLTVSFNIAKKNDEPYTYLDKNNEPFKCEVRACLLDKKRLLSLLPLYNSQKGKYLELPWHQSLYRKIKEIDSEIHSYRGGDCRTYYIHIQNYVKRDINLWYNILQSAESGEIPLSQYGNVELSPPNYKWLKKIDCPYIFLIRGKDVSISKFKRCIDSVQKQDSNKYGIVFVDAGSKTAIPEYIKEIFNPKYNENTAVYYNQKTLTAMENHYIAITELCKNNNSVIITLDMDDALIGNNVIKILDEEYNKGADFTCGSMIRTDKICDYPADVKNPRKNRGGNVWQHLRSFKKELFEKVPEDYFKIDGEWIDFAEDWAFMVPMTEISSKPVYIKKQCYYYEPTGSKNSERVAYRESIIGKIMSKPSLKEKL